MRKYIRYLKNIFVETGSRAIEYLVGVRAGISVSGVELEAA
jgi:hypothetical protein